MNDITVTFSTYKKIKEDIINGNLKPNSKLKLQDLKKNYNVSNSTLRETLSRLSSEGYVISKDQRGFFVCSFSSGDLREIGNLRILVEKYGIELSFKNNSIDWESNVIAAYHKLNYVEKKIDQDLDVINNWKEYDYEFHRTLISECGSRNLLEIHSNLYDRYRRYQIILQQNRGKDSENEHYEIFQAALNRDINKANKYLEIHLIKGIENIIELMK